MSESRRPLKRFSQNFLNNPIIQNKIVDALEIQPTDTVIEIGPGKGALTKHIIQSEPARTRVVEIDSRWVELLSAQFAGKIEIIQKDFLKIKLTDFADDSQSKLKIIGNLPYHITSPILFQLIDHYSLIQSAVMMVQKEVAKRIVAKPSTKDYGILSVICQTYADTEYLFEVEAGNFFPEPAVDSAVFKMHFYDKTDGLQNEVLFRKIVRGTFNNRRKMLHNSLGRNFDKSIVYSLESVDLKRRPEELTVQDFKTLTNELDNLLKQAPDEH